MTWPLAVRVGFLSSGTGRVTGTRFSASCARAWFFFTAHASTLGSGEGLGEAAGSSVRPPRVFADSPILHVRPR
jgi:hypothetical protein